MTASLDPRRVQVAPATRHLAGRVPGWLLSLALAALLFWLIAWPLLLVAAESVRGPAGLTLGHFGRLFAESREWQALWASLWTSLASVVLDAMRARTAAAD